jgi:hypothetical protein
MPELPQNDSWYREVLELRRKAGEYKVGCILLISNLVINLLFLSYDSVPEAVDVFSIL